MALEEAEECLYTIHLTIFVYSEKVYWNLLAVVSSLIYLTLPFWTPVLVVLTCSSFSLSLFLSGYCSCLCSIILLRTSLFCFLLFSLLSLAFIFYCLSLVLLFRSLQLASKVAIVSISDSSTLTFTPVNNAQAQTPCQLIPV